MPLENRLRHLSAWLLIGALGTAQAQDDCQLTISEPLLDFGLMNRTAQKDSAPQRWLGERRLSVHFNCPQPTDMSLFYRALAAGSQRLRFTEHGSYEIQAGDGVLDGQAVELGLLPANGQPPCSMAQY